MNPIAFVAMACAVLIGAALVAVLYLRRDADADYEERPRMFDLLERKLDVLSAEVSAGWLSEGRRTQIVRHLLQHIDHIAAMDDLLRLGPAGSVFDAEIIHTEGAPELMIWLHHGYMQTWLCRLYELGYTDKLCQGANPQLRGAVNVTLATKARIAPLPAVRREVAA